MSNTHENLETPWFITNYVLAAVDEPQDADKAVDALRYAAFHPTKIQNLTGQEAANQIDTSCEHCSVFVQVARVLWRYISIQGNILRELEQQAKVGKQILAVHVQDREEAELAGKVLLDHGAHNIEHFGPLGEVVELSR